MKTTHEIVISNACELANQLENRTRRFEIPVRKKFVCNSEKVYLETPLHQLYVGGKGNPVAVKLYLAIIWFATSKPYEIVDIPATGWATLLGLERPETSGKRRIYNALKKLQGDNLISLENVPGRSPKITLLSENGRGEPYVLPGLAAVLDKSRNKPVQNQNIYFKVPTSLWTQGVIQRMSGAALAFLLILLSESANERDVWFSMDAFSNRYNFDIRTRRKGAKELIQQGLLEVTRVPMDAYGNQSFSLGTKQLRNVYRLVNLESIS